MAKTKKIYRIRHKITGMFSMGGESVHKNGTGYGWSKNGKIWTGLGPLRNHLNGYAKSSPGRLDDWEVITYDLVETESSTSTAVDMLNPNVLVSVLKQ